MSEDYQIVSRARGEPLPEGCTGVRVRVQLSGCPRRRTAVGNLCARAPSFREPPPATGAAAQSTSNSPRAR